jgi:DNA replication protein DnaC
MSIGKFSLNSETSPGGEHNTRYEHGSMILITTNKAFGHWAEVLADEAIATATIDRLLHHAHVYSLKGDSYRMKDRLKIGVVDPM